MHTIILKAKVLNRLISRLLYIHTIDNQISNKENIILYIVVKGKLIKILSRNQELFSYFENLSMFFLTELSR